MNWQVKKWSFPLGFLCRKRVLACSCSGLFNFRLLFAPANCLEIVQEIRDFWGDCLNFWLFIKRKRCSKDAGQIKIVFTSSQFTEYVKHEVLHQVQQQIHKYLLSPLLFTYIEVNLIKSHPWWLSYRWQICHYRITALSEGDFTVSYGWIFLS